MVLHPGALFLTFWGGCCFKNRPSIIILSKFNLNLLRNSSDHFTKSFKSFVEPVCRTKKGSRRLTHFLPKILNNVLKNSTNLELNQFKRNIFENISIYFNEFKKIWSNIY